VYYDKNHMIISCDIADYNDRNKDGKKIIIITR